MPLEAQSLGQAALPSRHPRPGPQRRPVPAQDPPEPAAPRGQRRPPRPPHSPTPPAPSLCPHGPALRHPPRLPAQGRDRFPPGPSDLPPALSLSGRARAAGGDWMPGGGGAWPSLWAELACGTGPRGGGREVLSSATRFGRGGTVPAPTQAQSCCGQALPAAPAQRRGEKGVPRPGAPGRAAAPRSSSRCAAAAARLGNGGGSGRPHPASRATLRRMHSCARPTTRTTPLRVHL